MPSISLPGCYNVKKGMQPHTLLNIMRLYAQTVALIRSRAPSSKGTSRGRMMPAGRTL
jgi:hypothetical protein